MKICLLLLFVSFAVAAKPITISTNFEGGALGKIEQVNATHFRCGVKGESDQDGRNRQANWYSFCVNEAKGKTITIDLVDLPGEYNYRPNRGAVTGDTLPWYSEDNRHWKQIETAEYQADVPLLRLRLTPRTNQLWIAHVPPYTNQHLQRLLQAFKNDPHLRQQTIGKTVQGRDLLLLTITDERVPAADKKVIWLMFRQHSWEAGSSWAGEGAIRFLLSDAPAAVIMRQTVIFKIFPLCDPDGVARGGVRFNANGFDLNRNWDAVDAGKMPEIAAQRKAVLDWVDSGQQVDMFLSLHNTETSEYLEGPPDVDGRHRRLMERLFKFLSAHKTFAPTRPPQSAEATTTAGKPGRMTVIQGLFHDRQLPAFLIELMITKHPKLGHQPTPADRQQFGADLVQAMWQAVGR
ncbi:MAG TPA: M14-type cytosolic carboxypeptidase [Blastocatellia bacterium]|nr:M14-type cytosolic carboxypeptidase [Blastocatellia bacterium]